VITVQATGLASLSPQAAGSARSEHQKLITDGAAPAMREKLAAAGIDTELRIAHFLAQTCEESDGYCTTEEYASGEEYQGRVDLGNTHPGDGVRFKGRGLIMITGRYNYTEYGELLGLPLVTQPQLAAQPVNAVAIAIAFWTQHGLNALADQDDIDAITRRVNGGLNGLATRQIYVVRALRLLTPPVPPTTVVALGC
jgi:putative chitinase